MENTLSYNLSKYGPFILVIITWYNLWGYKNLFFYFTVGLVINTLLNLILKGIIQHPRPLFDKEKVHLAKTNAKEYFYQNGIPFNIFGMPSGHAQNSSYATVFTYLSTKNINLLYFYIAYTFFICYKRVDAKLHDIPQIIVGTIVGSSMGLLMYYLATGKIKGKIREKPDDNGPF